LKDLQYPGGKDAVLLLHGLASSPLEMLPLAKQLQRAGFTVHAPYLAGYGCSESFSALRRARWEDWHRQALKHFDALKRKHRSVSVCGLCVGADLALALAAERGPAVQALCTLSTTLFYDGWNISRWRVLLPLVYYTPLRYWLKHKERPPYGLKDEKLRNWIARDMDEKSVSSVGASSIPMTQIYQTQRLIRHVKNNLSRVTSPTLIIHALEDDVASAKGADFVERHIGAGRITKILLKDSYHIVTLDKEKERVAQETIAFIRTTIGQAAPAERGKPTLRVVA
jgi:carboxylesterase